MPTGDHFDRKPILLDELLNRRGEDWNQRESVSDKVGRKKNTGVGHIAHQHSCHVHVRYMVELDLSCPVRQRERVLDEHNGRLDLPTVAARKFEPIRFKRAPLAKHRADVIASTCVNDDTRPLGGISSHAAHMIVVKMAEHDVANGLARD